MMAGAAAPAKPARVIGLPANAPRGGSRLARWFGRSVLWLGGWRVTGAFPDVPRLMIIVAPHSSAWDAVWGLAAKLALGVDVAFMAKQELFRGPLGWLLRALGGFGVDRTRALGVVGQAAERLRQGERAWLVIAPEGTRRRVERWKTGFWHIARAADVPVTCAWFHYPERTIGIGPTIDTSEDLEADMARVRALYLPYVGKNRDTR